MKRGQVTIFVIVGILLIGAVILFFAVFQNREIRTGLEQEFNPESFIDRCVKDSAREKIDIMLPQGGFVSPTDYKLYNDNKVAFLCKNINYYESCVAQYPRYITRLQEELEKEMREDVEECFITLEGELEKKNYKFNQAELTIDAVLKPETAEIIIYRDLQLFREGEETDFDYFSTSIKTNFYDLAYAANEITRQEAKYCYFEYVGFMLLYNDFDITKFTMSDSTKIYTITHKNSQEKMNIAIRGCAIPPGF